MREDVEYVLLLYLHFGDQRKTPQALLLQQYTWNIISEEKLSFETT